MICDWCRDFHYKRLKLSLSYIPSEEEIKTNPFVYGCFSFRVGNLQSHCKQTNHTHYRAKDLFDNITKEKAGVESEAARAKKLLSESKRKHLPVLFTNAYAVMKSGRPFNDFEFLIKLDKAKGVEVGNTYLNRKQGLEFGVAIADLLRDKLANDFKTSLFFNTILDECTDVYRLEQVIIYVRYAKRGKTFTKFVGIDNVIRANADQLFEMILKKLEESYHWKPPPIPLTGSEFDWNGWAIEENEDQSDGEGPSVENSDDSDTSESLGSDSDDDDIDIEIEVNELINKESRKTDDCSDLPLMVGITSDGANVLRGKKNGVHKKIKDVANQLMLSSHCISHRFQLATKSVMEKSNKSLKELFLFLEKLYKYHHNSAVVTAVYRETVKVLEITGATAVIRVNGTRWISHVQLALKNLLNGYKAHVQTYNELQQADKYSAASKSQSLYFSRKLNNRQFMEFAIFIFDVVNSLAIFSKLSQDRNISCTAVNDSLQKCLIKLDEFYADPNRGDYWKKRESIIGKSTKGTVLEENSRKLVVRQLRREIKDRCDNLPVEADLATQLLKPSEWTHSEFFKMAGSCISPNYNPTEIFNSEIKKIITTTEIRLQLESKDIDTSEILSEWTFLKLKMSKWDKKDFPPVSWESIGSNFEDLNNLFGLIDYFLTLSVSSAEAERGFSLLKSLKPSKRAVLSNRHLQRQMLINIDGPEIESFEPQDSIDYWYNRSISKNSEGKARAKRPAHGDKPHAKPGPKPKQSKLNFVAI